MSTTTEDRVQRSVQKLHAAGLLVRDDLPAPNPDAPLRDKEETCRRAVSLALVAMYADDVRQNGSMNKSRMFIALLCQKYEARDFLSESERAFFITKNPSEEEIIAHVWLYESLYTLLWALSYIDELDIPAKTCDVEKAIGVLTGRNFATLRDGARMRPRDEILDAADLFARLNALCEADEGGYVITESVGERHRALQWLCGQNSF